MGSGFNSNTYIALRRLQYREVFLRQTCILESDEEMGSMVANSIIVDDEDREASYDLEGQAYIDLMITLGYIKLKA